MFDCDLNSSPPKTKNGTRLPRLGVFVSTVTLNLHIMSTTLITGLFLLSRLKKFYPQCRGVHDAGHRLFLAATLCASKSLYDEGTSNRVWAERNGYFDLKELNQMEKELLAFLDFRLYISREEYNEFVADLERRFGLRGFSSSSLSSSSSSGLLNCENRDPLKNLKVSEPFASTLPATCMAARIGSSLTLPSAIVKNLRI